MVMYDGFVMGYVIGMFLCSLILWIDKSLSPWNPTLFAVSGSLIYFMLRVLVG